VPNLTDAHEVLIGEYEELEREFDKYRATRTREAAKLRAENRDLRHQLRLLIGEVAELQSLLERAWIRT
jgi:uncharacterized protein YlxW (UPF0749 family)